MAAVSTTAKIPLKLNLSNRLHQGENWKSSRREGKFYELAAGSHKKAQKVRVASMLNAIGKEGMNMCELFQWQYSSDALGIDKVLETYVTKPMKDMFSSNVSNCQVNRLIIKYLH